MYYKNIIIFFAFVAIVLIAIPATNGPLILDSTKLYELENHIQSAGGSLYSQTYHQGVLRSVSYASFSLNIIAADGVSSVMMKWTNIGIHLFISFLIYLLCKRLFAHSFKEYYSIQNSINLTDQRVVACALGVAGLWLFAPINLSTAFYTTQRIAQLSTLFVVLGLLLYVHARDVKNQIHSILLLIGVFLCGVLALLSKENGIILFPLILLIEISIWNFKGLYFSSRIYLYSILTGTFLILLFVFSIYSEQLLNYSQITFSVWERLLTQSRVLISYLVNILLPNSSDTGLYNDGYVLSTGLLSPASTLFSISFHISLVSLAIYMYSKRKLFSIGILFFYIAHLVESTVIPLELYFLHRNYLPSIGIFIAVISLIEISTTQKKKKIVFTLMFVYLLFFIAMDYAKSIVWSERANIYISAFKHHPDSPRAISNYVQLLISNGHYSEGIKLLDKLVLIAPEQELRTKLQKLYVLCLMKQPIDPSYYKSIATTQRMGRQIEISQALNNMLSILENKQCNYLNIQAVISSLDDVRSSYQYQGKDPWNIDYFIISLLFINNNKTAAYKRAEVLFQQGEVKAGYYLYDLLINEGKTGEANLIKKRLLKEEG